MKKTLYSLTLASLLCVGGNTQAQILRNALKELGKAVTVDNGKNQKNNNSNPSSSAPVQFSDLKVYGDPTTGSLTFYVKATRTAKSAKAISLGVLTVTDDKGNVIPSYTGDNKNSLPWYPITDGIPTKITIDDEESVIVNPTVTTLQQVILCGSNGDRWPEELAKFSNVPIEWRPRKAFPACWPAEHYLSRRNIFIGTPVVEYTGRIETAKKGEWNDKKYAINYPCFIHLAGIVGNSKTGEVRIIIKVNGNMGSSNTQFFDEDGNMYQQKSNAFVTNDQETSTGHLSEIVSTPFRVPTTVKNIQKLTIGNWSFFDIPIQWVAL